MQDRDKMTAIRLGAVGAALLSAACLPMTDFKDAVTKIGRVRITGWARIHGEMMLYPDEASMRKPGQLANCISARFGGQGPENLRRYDGRKVEIVGTAVDYRSLPDDDAPLLPRKLLDGVTIPNFCFGQKVILLERVRETSRNPWFSRTS